MSDKINFRFMSGEHIGSSLKLAPGRYSIGGMSDCDICLNDEELSAISFILEIDDAGHVTVESQDRVLKIDGEIVDGKASLGAGQLLSFGLASLMYVAQGQQFMQATMDKIIGHSVKDEADTQNDSQKETDESQEISKEQALDTVTVQKGLSERSYLIFNILGVILLGAILVTLIAGSFIFENTGAYKRDLNAVSSYIKAKGYSTLGAELDEGQIIVISGSLKDEMVFRSFLKNLPETSCATRLDITLANQDLKAIEKSFLLHGFHVRAEQIDDNVYKIYGYARDAYTVYPAFAKAQKDFDSFTFKNALTYEKELQGLIEKHNADLARDLAIRPQSSYVLYEDRISQLEADALQDLSLALESDIKAPVHFVSYKEANHGAIETFNRVKKTPVAKTETKETVIVSNTKTDMEANYSAVGVAPEDVIGVTLKPMKFITLKNGIKYFEGASMPGGYILKSIAIDRLIFEKEGDSIEYALK